MTTLPENMFNDLLENAVTKLVQEKLELLLREEIKHYISTEHQGPRTSLNGNYTRTYQTRYGTINELQVPRDRKGYFKTRLFQPYQRREGWLEEAIIHMYKGGMSTREVAKFIESCSALNTRRRPLVTSHRPSWRTLSSGRNVRSRNVTP